MKSWEITAIVALCAIVFAPVILATGAYASDGGFVIYNDFFGAGYFFAVGK